VDEPLPLPYWIKHSSSYPSSRIIPNFLTKTIILTILRFIKFIYEILIISLSSIAFTVICNYTLWYFINHSYDLTTMSPYCSFSLLINSFIALTVGIASEQLWLATNIAAEALPNSNASTISHPSKSEYMKADP
jgi:hypothetical protein